VDGDLAGYVAVTRLQRTYGDVCTRRAWAELPALCTPDSVFTFRFGGGAPAELSGAAGLQQFGAGAVERFSFYQYIVLNTVVSIAGNRADARLGVLEIGVDRESGEWLEFYGHYDDVCTQVDGTWRFARRDYRLTARRAAHDVVVVAPPG
jgi:hypothetical protein